MHETESYSIRTHIYIRCRHTRTHMNRDALNFALHLNKLAIFKNIYLHFVHRNTDILPL